MRRPSRLLSLLAVLVMAATACGPDGDDGGGDGLTAPTATATPPPSPTPSPTVDPSPTPTTEGTAQPSPTPTGPAADEPAVADLQGPCVLQPDHPSVERVRFAYPRGWQVEEDDCEFFDPELDGLEQGTEPDAAVSVRVADVAYARAAEPGRETRDEIRHVGAVSGHQAVRIRAESTGQGLRPEGEPVLRYLVALDRAGDDGRAGTLILSARPSSGAGFAAAAEALDRMSRTVLVVPSAVDEGEPIVVARVEGGGNPFAVTLDGDCLRLHLGHPTDPVADEACDVPAGDGISGAILTDGDLRVVAGFAPPLALLVESDAASAPYGAFTTSLEGAVAFAYDVVEVPVEVRALDVHGERIATATIG